MSRESDWVAGNLKKVAARQVEVTKPLRARRRPIRPTEQMRRFLDREEFQRVLSGEVSPTEYARYQKRMLEKLGIPGGK